MKKYLIIGIILLLAGFAISAELQSFYLSKFSGINNRINDKLLQDSESPDMSNFNLEEVGSITERDVFGQYNSSSGTLGSNSITGLFKHYTSTSKSFIACAGSNVGLGSGGVFTSITPTTNTVTAGTFWTGKSFNNKFYMFNPSVPMQIYDGIKSALYTPGATAYYPSSNCSFGEIHKNRFWAARSDTLPYRLYWASLNNAEDWVTTGGYADLPDITQEITGIISWGGYLYVFTETNIYILLGSTPNDFSLRKTNSMVGAIAPRSIKTTDMGICFLAYSGVYAFDGNNSNKISDKIDVTISNMSKTMIDNACALYDGDHYWLAYTPQGSSYNSKILIYDILLKDWYIYTGNACNISYFERAYGGTDKGELYGGSSINNGFVYQLQEASGTESITHSTESDFDAQITFNSVVFPVPAVAIDSGNDRYTKLLLHFNGTDGTTTYTSEDAGKRAVTFLNTAHIETDQKRFGNSSLLLDSATNDSITLLDSDDWHFTGDFTEDFWVRFTSVATSSTLIVQYTGSDINRFWLYWSQGDNRLYFFSSTNNVIDVRFYCPFTPIVNTWYHIAMTRNSNTWYMFINGVSQTLTLAQGAYACTLPNLTSTLQVGRCAIALDGTNPSHSGYIDELRISKGIARWTKDFDVLNREYMVLNGTLTSQNIQINAAGATTLDEISWTGDYPTNTKISFQTRTGTTNDTVYFNNWQYWSSANTVTLNTVTHPTVEWISNDDTNFGIWNPQKPQLRNILYYEDEDKISPNCVTFNTVGAVSKGKFAWSSIALVDLSSYDWLGIWYESPQTGNTVSFSMGEKLATENTVTFSTVNANTWEKAFWYIGGITSTARDEITKISIEYLGDTAGSVVLGESAAYNFYETGDTMTSTPNDWIQYRGILGSTYEIYSPELYYISLVYTPSLAVSETSLSSYYYTKPFDFKTPQLNKQFDSIFLECNTTTASTVTPNLCTIYCDYDIDYGTRTGTLAFVPQTTADTVRLIKNFPSSTYGKTMKLKIYNNDLNAKVKIKSLEVRYRQEGAQPN